MDIRLGQSSELSAVYWHKQDFYKVDEARAYDEAITRYAEWCKQVRDSQVADAFEEFLQTVER
jgi:hypothetical protein